MLLFSLEKESFENEFLFIKFSRLEMIKLVYLEFRLGLKFSFPRVKRDVTQLEFDNEECNKRPSIEGILKVDLKTEINVQNENLHFTYGTFTFTFT
jgi:hypothetical protein